MNITMTTPQQPQLEQPPEIRDWYFTFGFGQRLLAGSGHPAHSRHW